MKTCVVFIVGYSAGRDGLQEDITKIITTFDSIFQATIYDWTDLNKSDLEKELQKFSEDSWRQLFNSIDFVVTFLLAHGREEGHVIFPDGLDDIEKLLLTPLFHIKELDGKLKWLVVQTCRGRLNGPPSLIKIEQFDIFRRKKKLFKDFYFISYCTGNGTQSWQKGKSGKIYIASICDELRNNARDKSLLAIVKSVHTHMKQYGAKDICPDYRTNCGKSFYFN